MKWRSSLIIGAAAIALIAWWSWYCYNAGRDNVLTSNIISDLHAQVEHLNTELASVEKSTEIVVEYKDKIVEVEKKVPVYVTKVKEIFMYDDDITIPDPLVRLHNKIVCANNGVPESACGTIGKTEGPITLGVFAETVTENYAISNKNSIQLESLINWVHAQDAIINSPASK